jgi:hypothetical protein
LFEEKSGAIASAHHLDLLDPQLEQAGVWADAPPPAVRRQSSAEYDIASAYFSPAGFAQIADSLVHVEHMSLFPVDADNLLGQAERPFLVNA